MEIQFQLIAVFNDPEIGFKGNTAAVVYADEPYEVSWMQELAADFNQPATTFLWPSGENDTWNTRWFAPDGEIGLCGHGSMAAITFLKGKFPDKNVFVLKYPQGLITGYSFDKNQASIELDPIRLKEKLAVPELLTHGLGTDILEYYATDNKNLVLLANQEQLEKMKPNFQILRQLPTFGYAVTAPGIDVDFVSRTIVPHVQQLEDHATGSSHAILTPFWSEKLGKQELEAKQLSARGGIFDCKYEQGQVVLKGNYKVIAEGIIR